MTSLKRSDCLIEVNKTAIPLAVKKFNLHIKLYPLKFQEEYGFTIQDIDLDDCNNLILMLKEARDEWILRED